MKKITLTVIALIMLLAVTSCGGDEHTHAYTEENTAAKYFAADADCTSGETYFKSCECGEKGTETFEVGDVKAHLYVDGICTACKTEGTAGIIYTLTGEGYTVTGVEKDIPQLIIPATYKGLPVVAVADGAFSICKNLISVELGKNVTEISATAFDGCDKLIEIAYNSEQYTGPIATSATVHKGVSRVQGLGDFWFFVDFDLSASLIHYSGESKDVSLPSKFIIDESRRFILPQAIIASDFENTILLPVLEKYSALLKQHCKESNPDVNFDFIGNEEYEHMFGIYQYGCINESALLRYMEDTLQIARETLSADSEEYKAVYKLYADIIKLCYSYNLLNPQEYLETSGPMNEQMLKELYAKYPITKIGSAVYVHNVKPTSVTVAEILSEYIPDYNYSTVMAQELRAGVVHGSYSVSKSAFSGMDIESVSFPNGKIDITVDPYVFAENKTLVSLRIGNSVKEIGQYAFLNCTSLESVIFEETDGWFRSLQSATITGQEFSASALESPETAAKYITSESYYAKFFWKLAQD